MLLFFDKVKYRKSNLFKIKSNKNISKIKTVLYLFKSALSTKRITNRRLAFYDMQEDKTFLSNQKCNLKISEEHYRFALEASSARFWEWNIKTDTVFYSSESMQTPELKWKATFNNSKRWDDIIHPDDLEKYYATIKKHLEKKTSFYKSRHRIQTLNGAYKWIVDKGKVIERDRDGNPIKAIGVHVAISSQEEKELELIQKVELYRKQKQRLLNFSYIVAHNLNTHVSNIKLLLDFNNLKENKSNIETLMNLRTVSNDLSDTLTDLSQIVTIQNNPSIIIKPLQVNTYLNKVLSLINGYNHKHIATIINNVPEKAIVNFNPAYLESVLLNFCTNAIKYAHPDRFPIIKFDFFIENKMKILTITDNGLGIDLDKYGDLLFGMYKTFHRNKDAQGIGLYITKNQIEAMKGKVSVTSIVGQGTTFKIIFNN